MISTSILSITCFLSLVDCKSFTPAVEEASLLKELNLGYISSLTPLTPMVPRIQNLLSGRARAIAESKSKSLNGHRKSSISNGAKEQIDQPYYFNGIFDPLLDINILLDMDLDNAVVESKTPRNKVLKVFEPEMIFMGSNDVETIFNWSSLF